MKREINPVVMAVVIILAVVIVGGLLWRTWAGPTTSYVEVRAHPHPGGVAEKAAAFRAEHQRN